MMGVNREAREILVPILVENAELEDRLKEHLVPSDRVVIESTTNVCVVEVKRWAQAHLLLRQQRMPLSQTEKMGISIV
jgi:hypothetical protein